jgi:flagellar motor switch protein FliG
MNPPSDGIRKAAILVASLDPATAHAMLDQLGPEQAQRVRQAMDGLGQIDSHERQEVIEEFFRVGPMVPGKHPPGIELDDRLARKLSMPPANPTPSEPPSLTPANARPFHFLHEAEVDKLARVLDGERPQTIALVLSHLPPAQAGSVLARLQPARQVDVIHRLVNLEETDPQILREVEQALESRLSQVVHMQRRRVAGLKAVAGILEASDSQVGMQILDNLAAHDQPLAERLTPPAIEFDDLAASDEATLTAVFQTAEPELAMTALVGAPPKLIDRVLRRLPPREAKVVRHKLDHPGPIRLSDVEGARRQIADLARRLAMEGRGQLPHQKPITVP